MDTKSKKSMFVFIIILILLLTILLGFIFKDKIFPQNNNNDNNNNYIDNSVTRLAEETNNLGNTENVNEVNNKIENALNNTQNTISSSTREEEIATYSTNLSGSTENRLTNIRITCDKLNGTVVNNGDTFSFCNTTGPSEASEGYKEATVFLNGEKVQALGGGNCQISSTLYNSVLAVPDLQVIERHEHGQDVSYVPEGKDAAVSYGSIDFKFKNNTGNDIKLYFSTDNVTLTATIVKLV